MSMQRLAGRIMSDYGKLLSGLDNSLYGHPESLLPYPKDQIRSAIVWLLENVQIEEEEIRASLKQGYVYLNQFIPDEKAALLKSNPLGGDFSGDNYEASRTGISVISEIKLAMEEALKEISRY